MASFGFHHLSLFSFFLLHLLLLSPQTQAREGKFMTFFSHFTTHNNVKDPQFVVVVPNKIKPHPHPHSPAPAPSPTESQVPSPSPSILAPEPAQQEAEFVDRGDGYGLYGTTTTTFENDSNDNKKESFKTSFPNTRFYSNSNNNNINNEDDDVYRNNYNNNNNNNYYNTPRSTNNFDQDSFYANNNNNNKNNNYYSNYERKGEGMSDTRLMEDGKYFYDIKGENQNYDNYYKAEDHTTTGSTKYYNNNGGNYYVKNNYNKYPNEFDTMEEYEKQQESQGYVP